MNKYGKGIKFDSFRGRLVSYCEYFPRGSLEFWRTNNY